MRIGIIYVADSGFSIFKEKLLKYLRKHDKTTRKVSKGNIENDLFYIDFIDSSHRNKEKFESEKYDYLYLYDYIPIFLNEEIIDKLSKNNHKLKDFISKPIYGANGNKPDFKELILDTIRNFYEVKIEIYRVKWNKFSDEVSIVKRFDWPHTMTSEDFSTRKEASIRAEKVVSDKIKEVEKQIKSYEDIILKKNLSLEQLKKDMKDFGTYI